jgi:hypothetical protein
LVKYVILKVKLAPTLSALNKKSLQIRNDFSRICKVVF